VFESSTLSDFINNNLNIFDLSVCNNFLDKPCSVEYTFAAEKRGAYSTIDHFFVSNIVPNFVRSFNVLHDVENVSDHLPLCLELDSTIIDYCCHAPITIKQSIDAVVGPVQSANCVYADTPSQSNGLDRNAVVSPR